MKDYLKIFENDSAVYAVIFDPKDNTIVEASDSLLNQFPLKDYKNKFLRDLVGCSAVCETECHKSVFKKDKINVTQLIHCQFLGKNFIVRYFETLIEGKKYNVMIFDDFEDTESLGNVYSNINKLYEHEIKNILNSLSCLSMELKDHVDLSQDIDFVSTCLDGSINNLISVTDQYFGFKAGQIGDTKCTLNITNLIKDFYDKEKINLRLNKLTFTIVGDEHSEDLNSYVGNNYVLDNCLLALMFSNIVNNSVKYTQEYGEIQLIIKPSDTGYSVIIENDAIITDEQREQFFSKDKKIFHGSGKGLYLSKMLSVTYGIDMQLIDRKDKVAISINF